MSARSLARARRILACALLASAWSAWIAPAGPLVAQEPAPAAVSDSARAGGEPAPPPGMTQEELDAAAAELAAQLRCPVCRNQSVLESSAELSQEMAALVKERLAMGESPEEVKDYFVSRYGEWILLEPQARGWNWLVWVLPVVALLGGAVVAWILLRRWSAAGGARSPAPPPRGGEKASLDPENERWLRDALRDG